MWGAIRYLLMAIASPLGSALADRLPRKLVLVAARPAPAPCSSQWPRSRVLLDGPAWAGLRAGHAGLSSSAASSGPAQMALMPSLTNRPEELTAANGTASTIESLAFFVGPAARRELVAVDHVETVFLLNAATFLVSAGALVLGHPPRRPRRPRGRRSADGRRRRSRVCSRRWPPASRRSGHDRTFS